MLSRGLQGLSRAFCRLFFRALQGFYLACSMPPRSTLAPAAPPPTNPTKHHRGAMGCWCSKSLLELARLIPLLGYPRALTEY